MWVLSGFADEIDPDPEVQCQVLDGLGIRYLELRSAWDTAGEGDGRLPRTVRALADDGHQGSVSMEPHLSSAHHLGGFRGPDDFVRATEAFLAILDAEGVAYR